MSTSSKPLLEAVVALLLADSAYMATIAGGLHDGSAPKGTPYPYTIISTATTVPEHAHDKDGYAHAVTFFDWSELEGRSECQDIAQARHDALHDEILTVAGWPPTSIRVDFEDVEPVWDNDLKKELRRGQQRYRVSTLEA